MIVLSIVGILSAVMLPQYRRTLALAEASSRILELVSFAEQCAVAQKSGVSLLVAQPSGGPPRNCNSMAPRLISSRRWSQEASGVLCLGVVADDPDRVANILVAIDGTMSCLFEP